MVAACLLATAFACGGDDSGIIPDANIVPVADAANNLVDAAATGLFIVDGDCGELDSELSDPGPSLISNSMAFAMSFDPDDEGDLALLSAGGREILADGNEGGSSILSELFAFEVLRACDGATLLKTESEIEYDTPGTLTDLLTEIDGIKIGVSVTRAQTFPLGGNYTIDDAQTLLADKLGDVLVSSANVSETDQWPKQILAVMVFNRDHLSSLAAALPMVAEETRADTIVWLTVTDGPDDFIYTNQ